MRDAVLASLHRPMRATSKLDWAASHFDFSSLTHVTCSQLADFVVVMKLAKLISTVDLFELPGLSVTAAYSNFLCYKQV